MAGHDVTDASNQVTPTAAHIVPLADNGASGDERYVASTLANLINLVSDATIKTGTTAPPDSLKVAGRKVLYLRLSGTFALYYHSGIVSEDFVLVSPTLTDAGVKLAYERNADTNAFTDTEKTKLAGIEFFSDVNPTPAEIKVAYEGNANTNAFTDSDHSKLDGIEAGATVGGGEGGGISDWSATEAYAVGDFVWHVATKTVWRCKVARSASNLPPFSDATHWEPYPPAATADQSGVISLADADEGHFNVANPAFADAATAVTPRQVGVRLLGQVQIAHVNQTSYDSISSSEMYPSSYADAAELEQFRSHALSRRLDFSGPKLIEVGERGIVTFEASLPANADLNLRSTSTVITPWTAAAAYKPGVFFRLDGLHELDVYFNISSLPVSSSVQMILNRIKTATDDEIVQRISGDYSSTSAQDEPSGNTRNPKAGRLSLPMHDFSSGDIYYVTMNAPASGASTAWQVGFVLGVKKHG